MSSYPSFQKRWPRPYCRTGHMTTRFHFAKDSHPPLDHYTPYPKRSYRR
jgi:hypothetical protein